MIVPTTRRFFVPKFFDIELGLLELAYLKV